MNDKRHEPVNQDQGHPLHTVSGISPEVQEILAAHWIETAEEVLAISLLPDGRQRLADLITATDFELDHLLRELRDAVGEEVYQSLASPVKVHPLGVRLTDEQKKMKGPDPNQTDPPTSESQE